MGHLVDRFGSFRVGSFGATVALASIYVFYYSAVALPPMLLFVVFMVAMSFRNVSHTTLTSKVPGPAERARFQSIQSAVQHAASAIGAFVSSQLLTTTPLLGPDGHALKDDHGRALVKLVGMPRVAMIAMVCTASLPLLFYWVEKAVKRRDEAAPVDPARLAQR